MTQTSALPLGDEDQLRSYWDEPGFAGLTRAAWLRMGIICLLLLALFWPNLRRLWFKTNPFTGEANWGHSFFVPLIGLYYLYLNREELLSPKARMPWPVALKLLALWLLVQLALWGSAFFVLAYRPTLVMGRIMLIGSVLMGLSMVMLGATIWITSLRSRSAAGARQALVSIADSSAVWFGFYSLLWGLVFYAWSIWPGQNDLFKDCSMIATLFGVVLLLGGWEVMRIAWFPIFFLGVAFPWPPLVYSQLAMPLQKLAAEAAVLTMKLTGVAAGRAATTLSISRPDGTFRGLEVAEACAGIKSLMTFVAVGAAVGFLSNRATWQKIFIAASAVPIAILCNSMRVAGQGLLDYYVSENFSQSFAHQFVGMVMLIPAFFLIMLVAWVVDNLFVEEVDERAIGKTVAKASAKPAELVIEIPRPKGAPVAPAPQPAEAGEPATGPEPKADLAAATMLLTSARSRNKPQDPRTNE